MVLGRLKSPDPERLEKLRAEVNASSKREQAATAASEARVKALDAWLKENPAPGWNTPEPEYEAHNTAMTKVEEAAAKAHPEPDPYVWRNVTDRYQAGDEISKLERRELVHAAIDETMRRLARPAPEKVIVSRHAATVEYIREIGLAPEDCPVLGGKGRRRRRQTRRRQPPAAARGGRGSGDDDTAVPRTEGSRRPDRGADHRPSAAGSGRANDLPGRADRERDRVEGKNGRRCAMAAAGSQASGQWADQHQRYGHRDQQNAGVAEAGGDNPTTDSTHGGHAQKQKIATRTITQTSERSRVADTPAVVDDHQLSVVVPHRDVPRAGPACVLNQFDPEPLDRRVAVRHRVLGQRDRSCGGQSVVRLHRCHLLFYSRRLFPARAGTSRLCMTLRTPRHSIKSSAPTVASHSSSIRSLIARAFASGRLQFP